MKLINSSWEILEQKPGLEGIYEAIELAGRVCYKSSRPEGKTAKDFVDMLIKRGHLSPLEHGTIYLKIPYSMFINLYNSNKMFIITKYRNNPFSKVVIKKFRAYITTNMRVLYENNWLDDLQYLCEPTEHHEKRVGVRVNCSIGISREANRHRTFSICEQSTRYCNYSKDRFNNELTFVIPSWYEKFKKDKLDDTGHRPDGTSDMFTVEDDFTNILEMSEATYKAMLTAGGTPQQAREVLPLATATEVVYTGYTSDWSHFFNMRCDNAAHPDIKKLAIPLKEEFIKRGYIE